jgi:hypothetical protein
MQRVSAWTDRINLRVVRTARPRPSDALVQVFRDALTPDPDPADVAVYFDALFGAWGEFAAVSVAFMVALAFTGDQIDGNTGNIWGLAIGAFLVGFCLAGEFDASWRLKYARRARRLVGDETADRERASRLIGTARANHGGVILQFLGGLIAVALAVGLG